MITYNFEFVNNILCRKVLTKQNNYDIFKSRSREVYPMGIAEGLKRGTIELALLSLLRQKDMYGYEICQHLKEKSQDKYIVTEGSLYPVLYRLIERGCITDRSEKVGKRRTRVYYHIEPKGIDYLEEIKREYFTLHDGIMMLLTESESE